MALIKCEECGKEIPSKAAVCPNCGAPIAAKPNKSHARVMGLGGKWELAGFLIILGGLFIIAFTKYGGTGAGVALIGFFVFLAGRFA